MSFYHIVKAGYKRCFPKAWRNRIYIAMPHFVKVIRARVISLLEKCANHDEIYDKEYYIDCVDQYMARSCETIAQSIIDSFSPKSAVDVGCGTGLLLLALQKRGISCRGLDYSQAAIDICRERGLQVIQFDLENDTLPPDYIADITISTEVAEHLPESNADCFVDILCNISNNIILTAAEPGASYAGTDHVNEQPNEYWIEKFETRFFRFDKELTDRWRRNWKAENVSPCYINNLMLFRKSGTSLTSSSCDHSEP